MGPEWWPLPRPAGPRAPAPSHREAGHRPLASTIWKPPCSGVPFPSPPRAPGAAEHRPHLPRVLGKPGRELAEPRGCSTAGSPLDSAHAGRGRRGVCGRTLPRHASGSSDNRLSDCDRTSPTSGLQNGHKPQASLFDKPTRPDVLGRSLSNWCKVWRSESRIFHPAYCVLSFDTGSGFTFASDYRSALIRREPALLRNE